MSYLLDKIEALLPVPAIEVDKLEEARATNNSLLQEISELQHLRLKYSSVDLVFIEDLLLEKIRKHQSLKVTLLYLENKKRGIETRGYDISSIKQKSILSVVEVYRFKTVKSSNNRVYIALRNEKTPSCCLYLDSNTWYDYGSHKHGDIIDFVREIESCDFKDACKILQSL